ncbi:hypothetical protein Y032_0498g2529 [Ancylostoma ceylanicum]|uniref:Uncharacterized protein n=1 Tax=Ancylostoma ceylanicum TaxID=53326 RepID=A0A016WTX4_9BILA|nr:hypothetical protein Y032_0498g2529 [Ancylostoma ceylanicum]
MPTGFVWLNEARLKPWPTVTTGQTRCVGCDRVPTRRGRANPSCYDRLARQHTATTTATPAAATSTWRGRGNTLHPQRSPAPRGCCGRGNGNRD